MQEIQQHYSSISEKDRLTHGIGMLEFARTKAIIKKHLQSPPKKILDIGGAAGVYAFWLAEQGYDVTLVDAMQNHIDQAKQIQNEKQISLSSIVLGDARNLSQFEDDSFDFILMLGPLYHLTESGDRMKALYECRRIVKKGGKIFAAGINRYASLYDGLSRGLIDDPYFETILRRDLIDGQHRNPEHKDEYFTTAVFLLPEEMQQEFHLAGFIINEVLPVEGPMWITADFEKRWADEKRRNQLMDLLSLIERDEKLLHLTQHYIVVAEK